ILHRDVDRSGILAKVIEPDDVGVRHRGGSPCLAHEAEDETLIPRVLGAQDLQRDGSLQSGIPGTPGNREAAFAYRLKELVAAADQRTCHATSWTVRINKPPP